MAVKMTADQFHALTRLRLHQVRPERSGRGKMEVTMTADQLHTILATLGYRWWSSSRYGWGGRDVRGNQGEGEVAGRQEQGQGSEDTDHESESAGRHEVSEAGGAGRRGRHYYLLADPRLAEAHDYSTVVPFTGADRSAPQPAQDLISHIPSTRATREAARMRARLRGGRSEAKAARTPTRRARAGCGRA